MDLHQQQHHHHHHQEQHQQPPQPPPPTAATATANRAEAERLLGIAEKLLQSRDLSGSREFAMLAQETEPLLEGTDQILAIADVLMASERRVGNNRSQPDWYSVLQTDRGSLPSDPDLLKRNYRRLALLLHPDKNKFPFADTAFKFVADAWAFLSDPSKRSPYDRDLAVFQRVDLRTTPPPPPPPSNHHHHHPPPHQGDKDKLPVRRSPREKGNHENAPSGVASAAGRADAGRRGGGGGGNSFWTACPYCYVLYEYPRGYEECCLRCQNCDRAFHAAPIPAMPPLVPGKEAYYCCWGFFPLGFSLPGAGPKRKPNHQAGDTDDGDDHEDDAGVNVNNPGSGSGFPNWMPGMFTPPVAQAANFNISFGNHHQSIAGNIGSASRGRGMGAAPGAKKRGRPRKNPLPP